MNSSSLPQEMLDSVLDHIPAGDESLRQYALASRHFGALAQRRLFSSIRVDVSHVTKHLGAFKLFLDEHPHLAMCVLELVITQTPPVNEATRMLAPVLQPVLGSLPRIDTLRILDFNLVGSSKIPFSTTHSQLRLCQIKCNRNGNYAGLLEVLSLFGAIEELEIQDLPDVQDDLPLAPDQVLERHPGIPEFLFGRTNLSLSMKRFCTLPGSYDSLGLVILLRVLQKSNCMRNLASINLFIQDHAQAAELGEVLRTVGSQIKHCKLDLREIEYYGEQSGDVLSEFSVPLSANFH